MSQPSRSAPDELRRDVEASLATRRELGPEYQDEVAGALADRVDELVARRIADARLATQEIARDREDERTGRTHRFVLGIVSLGAGIPVSGIAAGTDLGIVGFAVAWAGIVGVNVAAGWRGRRRD